MRGKYRQAVAAKTGEGPTGSSTSSGEEDKKFKSQHVEIKELCAEIERLPRQGKESGQDESNGPVRKESAVEEDWGMEVEEEAESRKKLDAQMQRLQRQLRDVERFIDLSQETQSGITENLQRQLQEVEQERHDLLPEHQRVQKRSPKIQSGQDKKKNMQSEMAAAEDQMWKIREEVDRNEERFRLLSDKVGRNRMAEAELQGLQAGEERRGSDASQTGDCCMEVVWQQFIALGANRVEAMFQRYRDATVTMNKNKVKPVSSWRYRCQDGLIKALQRVLWSLIFLGFGVHMVNTEEQGIQVRQMSEKELYPIHRVEDDSRWRRMQTLNLMNGVWMKRPFGKVKKRETARERTKNL